MNALEQFYIELDSNDWDVKQENDINQILQKVNEILIEEGLNDIQHLAEVDRQAFHFNKSPEKRLSSRMGGVRKLEDGSEIPFEWPDIKDFTKDDFDYLYNRFNTCKNTYAKTEYGLVLFYTKYKQDNNFVIELLNSFFELLKIYIEKARIKEDKNYYFQYSRIVLSNALYIANNRKGDPDINTIFELLIKYTFDIHQNIDIAIDSSLRTIIDFTDFTTQYFKDFKQYVDLNKIIEKNWEIAKFLSDTNLWGAVYIADISIKLNRKLGFDARDWFYFKAGQYEKLSIESKERNNLASVSFVEKAMSIYKLLKDKDNLKRLQENYQQLRSYFKLNEVKLELPQAESQRIMELIKKEVEENDEEYIVKTLMLTPMIVPLDVIKKWNEESSKESVFLNMIPISIHDKFGNTIKRYSTDEEKKEISLLNTYEAHIQIATQTIIRFFVEAFRVNKISENGILSLLEQSWMGNEAFRKSNGGEFAISYLKIVESGIYSFFQELEKWKLDPNYIPNFVCATDSLVLKAEYFLRKFCEFLNIPTFKPKDKGVDIKMERTLDDILSDNEIKNALTPDDYFFIKFILIEKAGQNLRNRIAHGLMDNVEYGLEYPILAIIIILKLSNYQFTNNINL